MLYNVKIVYDNGRVTDNLVHSSKILQLYPKRDKIHSSMVSVHKYEVEQLYPPILYVSRIDGKKWIMPAEIEVHPDTTIDDINWTKPKLKKEINKIEGTLGTYKTIYNPNKKTYTCSCPGFFSARSKVNVCKHIKSLKQNK